MSWVRPAVDDHGSGVGEHFLLGVHLSQEAEDPTGLLGDPVVGPAQVLVVPDTGLLGLGERLMDGEAMRVHQHGFVFTVCIQRTTFTVVCWLAWGGTFWVLKSMLFSIIFVAMVT